MISPSNFVLPGRPQLPLINTDHTKSKPILKQGPYTRLPKIHSPSPIPVKYPFYPKRSISQQKLNPSSEHLSPISKTPFSDLNSKRHINCITRLAYKTRAGQVNGKPKLKNQDSFIIKPSFLNTRGVYLFSVQDGHGPYGDKVSELIRETYPSILENLLDPHFSSFSIERKIRKSVQKLLEHIQESGIETAFSGSTLISLILNGQNLVCSNIGDSRAILGTFEENWDFIPLSNDHNLKRDDERERVMQSNGRIACETENGLQVGPERIWLRDENLPGLAMTRSLGDRIAHTIGASSEPEVLIKKLSHFHKFIVIASDGVWEKISNEEVAKKVGRYWEDKSIEDATVWIVNEATKRWGNEYRDDITVIVVFLNVSEY